MSTNILIADSSVPFALSVAETLRARGASVAVLSNSPSDAVSIPWNRPSPLSARTVMLDAKNRFAALDCAVFFFDVSSIPQACRGGDQTATVRLVDEYIRGPLLLVPEISARFREQGKGFFCFAIVCPPEDSGVSDAACAVAESAFARLAEETAGSCRALLCKLDSAEVQPNLDWLASQLLDPPSFRKDARWVKAGARSLFGKL